jgi:hypothetical protein
MEMQKNFTRSSSINSGLIYLPMGLTNARVWWHCPFKSARWLKEEAGFKKAWWLNSSEPDCRAAVGSSSQASPQPTANWFGLWEVAKV